MTKILSTYKTLAKDKVSLAKKILYGSGSFADQTWQWGFYSLALPIFNIEMGFSPILIGIVLSLTRIWDAFIDPVIGNISDNARTRFGRRRPFIAIGAVLAGFFYSLVWMVPQNLSDTAFFIYFLVIALLFFTSFSLFSVPFYAFGFELSPDYNERTRIMGVRIFANSLNGVILFPWIYYFIQRPFWSDNVQGIRVVGVAVGFLMTTLALIPALTIKERIKEFVIEQKKTDVWTSFKYTLNSRPFVFLVLAFFVAILSSTIVSVMALYPIAYKVFGGDMGTASFWYGGAEACHHIVTLIMIVPISYLSARIGKKKSSILFTSFIVLGSLTQLIAYNPDAPWMLLIPRIIMGAGWAGFWVLIPSMIADIIDFDEWKNGTRREGMFGAVHFWVTKIGFSLGFLASGFVIAATGFNIDLGILQPEGTIDGIILVLGLIPALGALIALYFLTRFPVSSQDAYTIRAELEKRRGES